MLFDNDKGSMNLLLIAFAIFLEAEKRYTIAFFLSSTDNSLK